MVWRVKEYKNLQNSCWTPLGILMAQQKYAEGEEIIGSENNNMKYDENFFDTTDMMGQPFEIIEDNDMTEWNSSSFSFDPDFDDSTYFL